MRILLLLVLLSSFVYADARFVLHGGGGIEGGVISGKPRPDGVAEVGLGLDLLPAGKRWGLGVVGERVVRPNAEVDIASEHKLDLLVRIASGRVVGGIGMGVRRLVTKGDLERPAATVWGYDLIRVDAAFELARAGRLGIDFYFAWTFGLYRGELYEARVGDMPYPTRDFTTISTAYILGLATSIHTNP